MRPYTLAVALSLVLIVLAHAIAPPSYSWTQYTLSHLAAQAYSLAWVMRLSLLSFGAIVCFGAVWYLTRHPRGLWPHALVLIYGLSNFLTGIFSTSPFVPGAPFSAQEASLHSAFANLAGISLSAAMVFFAIAHKSTRRKILDAAAFVLTMLLSGAFFASGADAGIIQRGLWIVGFTWLILLEVPALDRSTSPVLPPSA